MKRINFIAGILITLTLILTGCQEDNYVFGDIVAPSNLQVTATVVGADTNNPNGDGSGEVIFNATADNAITYKYTYNGSDTMAPSGSTTMNFGNTGTFDYTVTVSALGTAGTISSKSITVKVKVVYAPPADLLEMLTANSSRTWRIEAETAGHFGVGPADETSPIWWAANPYDKQGKGAYDDRFVFNIDGTFTHITNGTAYGKKDPMDQDLGDPNMAANSDNEYENYPLNDYSEQWALSAPGGQETLSFSNIGYHGFYVGGDHKYAILSRTANEMHLKTIGADGISWFVILIADGN